MSYQDKLCFYEYTDACMNGRIAWICSRNGHTSRNVARVEKHSSGCEATGIVMHNTSQCEGAKKGDEDVVAVKLRRRVTRAKIVQHKTLLYNKQLDEFKGRMAPQLFDRLLVIKLTPRDEKNGLPYGTLQSDYVPYVAYKYPETGKGVCGCIPAADCPDLFIPNFTRIKPYSVDDHWSGNEEFMLTLTDESGKRSFAYCIKHLMRKQFDLGKASCSTCIYLPEVLAIISPIHASRFYFALARLCVLRLQENLQKLKKLLDVVFPYTFPNNGNLQTLLERSEDEDTRILACQCQMPTLNRSDSNIVRRMGADITVAIIGALLAEQRVIISGDAIHSVSYAVQAVVSLLQPFTWPYTLIPVLPDSLLEIVNSPTPYLIGILRSNMYKLRGLMVHDSNPSGDLTQDDLVIVDLDGGIFVPQLTELRVASKSNNYKEQSAIALCEKLLIPRKLIVNLLSKMKAAINAGQGPQAEFLMQRALLSWFAALVGPYQNYNFETAFIAEANGDTEPLKICKSKLIAAHNSKSAKRFIEWFVETGVFREWIRQKVSPSSMDSTCGLSSLQCSEAANKRFDEVVLTLSTQPPSNRMSDLLTKAQNVLFRTRLRKKF